MREPFDWHKFWQLMRLGLLTLFIIVAVMIVLAVVYTRFGWIATGVLILALCVASMVFFFRALSAFAPPPGDDEATRQ